MQRINMQGTCSTGGAATIISSKQIFGKLYAVRWIDGTLADGVDAVLSVVRSDATVTLLTLTNANDDKMYYPRAIAQGVDGVDLTVKEFEQIVDGHLQLAITAGGNAGVGGAIVYVE